MNVVATTPLETEAPDPGLDVPAAKTGFSGVSFEQNLSGIRQSLRRFDEAESLGKSVAAYRKNQDAKLPVIKWPANIGGELQQVDIDLQRLADISEEAAANLLTAIELLVMRDYTTCLENLAIHSQNAYKQLLEYQAKS